MPYDIFISYRREGGRELARSLKSELERRGYRVFLDFDELNDGIFDRRIMEAIDAAPIFMVLLSPHALDRCVNADDWVRREIVMDSRDRLEQLVFVLRTYKIGDYYHENGKEGIVFEVDASGRHGKIMAMHDLSEKLAWCTKEEYETCRETEKMIGATDEQDGMKNLEVVRRIPSWREKYPAFSSCTTLGNEWYLPSRYEMQKLFDNREILSNIVENFGGQVLKNECYWSSFEVDAYNAASFIFSNRNFGPIKFNLYRVRPITIF